ncbi:hypothetical protein [Halovulum sp. GXIMD14793]
MIRAFAVLMSFLFWGPPSYAQTDDIVAACAAEPIGVGACDAEALAEKLGLMTAGDMIPFRDSRMESFAILTSLRLTSSAIFFNLEGDGCVAEEERIQAAEIWQLWVQLPQDALPEAAERFSQLNALMNNVFEMELVC